MRFIKDATVLKIYTSTSWSSVALVVTTEHGSQRVALPLGFEDTEAHAHLTAAVVLALDMLRERLTCAPVDLSLREFDATIERDAVSIASAAARAKAKYLISIAFAKAKAISTGVPVDRLISDEFSATSKAVDRRAPVPWITMISGQPVASTDLQVQSIMIVPLGIASLSDRIRAGAEISEHLGQQFRKLHKPYAFGDEGGYSTIFEGTDATTVLQSALSSVSTAVSDAGYDLGVEIVLALDFAAQYSRTDAGAYSIVNGMPHLSASEVVELCVQIAKTHSVGFVEDPLSPLDEEQITLTETLRSSVTVVADDFPQNLADASVVMPDRIGTISEAANAVENIRMRGQVPVASARSSETEDTFISSFAAALSIDYVKAGGMHRSERTAKYNELLRITERHETEALRG